MNRMSDTCREASTLEQLEPRLLLSADLTAGLDTSVGPVEILAGERFRIRLLINNEGDERARGRLDVTLHAGDDTENPAAGELNLLASVENKRINIRPGKSKKIMLRGTVPADLAGLYALLAEVDVADDIAETDETNNTVVADDLLLVTERVVDLASQIDDRESRTLGVVLGGDEAEHRLVVEIGNGGNASALKGQEISVVVSAVPTAGGDAVHIQTFDGLKISRLKPGRSKRFTFDVALPEELTGSYVLSAAVTPITGDPDDNNEALTDPAEPIVVADDLADLLMYDAAGAQWTYAVKARGGGAVPLLGKGTLVTTVTDQGSGSYHVEDQAYTEGGTFDEERQWFNWTRNANGLTKHQHGLDVDSYGLTLSFSGGLNVFPETLLAKQTHTDEAGMDLDIEAGWNDLSLSGSADVATTLLGYEEVTTPAGVFWAAKLKVKTTMVAREKMDTVYGRRTVGMRLVQNDTLYAAPNLGVVKFNGKLNVTVSLQGIGSESAHARNNGYLYEYSLPG